MTVLVHFSDSGLQGSFNAPDNFFTMSPEEQRRALKSTAGIVMTAAGEFQKSPFKTLRPNPFNGRAYLTDWIQKNASSSEYDATEDPNTWLLKLIYANALFSNPKDESAIKALVCLADPSQLNKKIYKSKADLAMEIAKKIKSNNEVHAINVFLGSNARKIFMSKNSWTEAELKAALNALLVLKG